MSNMEIYNKVRRVPEEAKKAITGGRLKGMTDINPMWRIQTLTEIYGPAGVGWYYNIADLWTVPGAGDEVIAFAKIALYVKAGEKWSEPIEGVGGSMLVEKEQKGLHTNDEAYKMALTDALSVACKALGFGADVYWQGGTKYAKGQKDDSPVCDICGKPVRSVQVGDIKYTAQEYADRCMKSRGKVICPECCKK